MAEATLAIRPNEYKQYFSEDPHIGGVGAQIYAVALVTVPPFPGENHIVSRPLACVCCQAYAIKDEPDRIKWGWVQMLAETKLEVGKDLEEMRDNGLYQVGEWAYLVLTNGKPEEAK